MHKDLDAMSKLVDAMQKRIHELEDQLERCRNTTEDVAIGQKLQCACCNEWKPCMCDKT